MCSLSKYRRKQSPQDIRRRRQKTGSKKAKSKKKINVRKRKPAEEAEKRKKQCQKLPRQMEKSTLPGREHKADGNLQLGIRKDGFYLYILTCAQEGVYFWAGNQGD